MAQQTAVNWLLENLQKVHKMDWDIVFIHAELMEKKQIIEAYIEASAKLEDIIKEAAEQYYKETYGRDTDFR